MHAIHEGLRGIGSVRHLRSGPAGEELVAKVILRRMVDPGSGPHGVKRECQQGNGDGRSRRLILKA